MRGQGLQRRGRDRLARRLTGSDDPFGASQGHDERLQRFGCDAALEAHALDAECLQPPNQFRIGVGAPRQRCVADDDFAPDDADRHRRLIREEQGEAFARKCRERAARADDWRRTTARVRTAAASRRTASSENRRRRVMSLIPGLPRRGFAAGPLSAARASRRTPIGPCAAASLEDPVRLRRTARLQRGSGSDAESLRPQRSPPFGTVQDAAQCLDRGFVSAKFPKRLNRGQMHCFEAPAMVGVLEDVGEEWGRLPRHAWRRAPSSAHHVLPRCSRSAPAAGCCTPRRCRSGRSHAALHVARWVRRRRVVGPGRAAPRRRQTLAGCRPRSAARPGSARRATHRHRRGRRRQS